MYIHHKQKRVQNVYLLCRWVCAMTFVYILMYTKSVLLFGAFFLSLVFLEWKVDVIWTPKIIDIEVDSRVFCGCYSMLCLFVAYILWYAYSLRCCPFKPPIHHPSTLLDLVLALLYRFESSLLLFFSQQQHHHHYHQFLARQKRKLTQMALENKWREIKRNLCAFLWTWTRYTLTQLHCWHKTLILFKSKTPGYGAHTHTQVSHCAERACVPPQKAICV